MFRLLADENFNGDIVRGLLLRKPDLDLIRVQDTEIAEAEDTEVLVWATAGNRMLLSHDRATMPPAAFELVGRGERVEGVIVVPSRMPISQAISEILLIVECSHQSEWAGRVVYLPL